jgi:hypothetical protein
MAVTEPVLEEDSSPSEVHLSEEELERIRELCKKSLFFLCRAVLGFKDLHPRIHGPVCADLEDRKRKRKIIVIPRTWFKSSIGSIGFPIWLAINDSNVRVLICQNSHSNACKKLGSIKKIFEKNALFKILFPELLPTSDCKWKEDVLEVNRTATHPEGTFEAAGTGTATTSRHFDVIIEDDTVSPEKDSMSAEMQQPTAMEIEKAIGWHKLTMPLLVNPSEGQIVVIGTRWAEEDLIGYILANFPEYHVITRAVRERDGKPAVKEEGGELAWPERFTEEVLVEIERVLGPYMFATLMMNCPMSAANMVFRRAWIRYYDTVDIVKLITCTTIDPASSKKEATGDPDYTVVLTSGVDPKNGQIYVLGYNRERMNPGETIDCLFTHYNLYHPVSVRVESTAYQSTLQYWIEQKQRKVGIFFPIEAVLLSSFLLRLFSMQRSQRMTA